MKLVNPRLLNIERKFRFSELIVDCKDFDDAYTKSDQIKNGCYGCKNLKSSWNNPSCTERHRIKFGWIKKSDDNTFEPNCLDYESKKYSKESYVESGCSRCKKLKSNYTGMCEMKHRTQEEVYRIG